jgi:SPP1 gp7 family putative phage head morphogenesis protein
MCDHHHIKVNNQVKLLDPTGTTKLRAKFYSEFYQSYIKISKNVKTSIEKNKIFHDTLRINQPISSGEFLFKSDPEKIQEFIKWLEKELEKEVYRLYIPEGSYPQEVLSGQWWPDAYIAEAYNKGTTTAASFLATLYDEPTIQGLLNSPVHINKVQLLYQRAFDDLKGINSEMSKQISRVLADGLIKGDNPRAIAREVAKKIRGIGIYRAKMLAHSEIIRAHSHGTLQMFELSEIEEVELLAEFLTAGDFRVCPRCKALSGKRYKIKDAYEIIPVHPFCRCTWIPYDPSTHELLGERYL